MESGRSLGVDAVAEVGVGLQVYWIGVKKTRVGVVLKGNSRNPKYPLYMMHSGYFSLYFSLSFVVLKAFGIKIMQSNLSGKGPQSDSTAFCRKRNVPAEIFQLLLKKTLFLLPHPFVQ